MDNGFSILLILWKNQFFVSLVLCVVLFVKNLLISFLSLIISCLLNLLGVLASFCSRAFRCVIKLLVWDLSKFFMKALNAMNCLLTTTFILSHKSRYVLYSFSISSTKSLISLFFCLDSLFHIAENCSVSLYLHAFCCFCCCGWYPALISGVLIVYMELFQIFFYLLRLPLCLSIWSVWEKVPRGAE